MRLAISNVNCTALTEQKCKHVHGFVVLARYNLSTLHFNHAPFPMYGPVLVLVGFGLAMLIQACTHTCLNLNILSTQKSWKYTEDHI